MNLITLFLVGVVGILILKAIATYFGFTGLLVALVGTAVIFGAMVAWDKIKYPNFTQE
jgi:hypothetical protein